MQLFKKNFLIIFLISFIGCNSTNDIDISQSDVEELLGNLEKVDNKVASLFMETDSPTEMISYLEDIKAMEGVENVWLEPSAFCVKMKNGGKVAWIYTPKEPENDTDELQQVIDDIRSSLAKHKLIPLSRGDNSDIAVCKNKRVCIINQQSNDENRSKYKILYNEMGNLFKELKFEEVRIVNTEEFTLNFIQNELTSYGIVFMITHGAYFSGKHWFLTGERINVVEYLAGHDLYNWIHDKIIMANIKEQRSNKLWYNTAYYAINEDYVDDYL